MDILILAAESAESDTISIIFPATAELVYGFIAFLLVFLVLSRIALPRLNTTLDERTQAIQGQMEQAEQARQEAQAERDEREAELAEARKEAKRIVDEAREEAETTKREIIADAEEQKAEIVASGQSEIDAERDRLLQELRVEVNDLSVRLAEKIVQKELDTAAHQGLVDEYIQQLSRTN